MERQISMGSTRIRGRAVHAAGAALLVLAAQAEKKPAPAPVPEMKPAVRIDVGGLGYQPPGAFYLTYRLSSAAMGFLDDDHLLFTFRMGGLLKRVPNDPLSDDDQEIRAVVLDLETGKAVRETKWRMHDRSQYLWPFGEGKFLVRVRDSLFVTNEGLQMHPYITFSDRVRAIQVSADQKTLVVETTDPAAPADPEEKFLGGPPVKVMVFPVGGTTPTMESHVKVPMLLPLMGEGLLDLLEGKANGSWVLRDVPFRGEPQSVAEVKSICRPSARPLSASVVLLVGCSGDENMRQVIAVSTKGDGELWRDKWENRFVWGWFTSAANGSRFVYESVEVNRSISTFDSLYPEDVKAQLAGVYDTETGKLVLVRDASPVLTAGQNVALSPDGKRFAILRNGAVEVYDLLAVSVRPAPDKREQAKKQGAGNRE